MTFWGAKTALLPSVNAVAVGAQEPQITLIGGPVFKTPIPGPNPIFGAHFLGWVNVIYLKCANVAKSTFTTFTSQLVNYGYLSTPVARVLVPLVAVLVPVRLAAFIPTKSLLFSSHQRTALKATPARTPPGFKITGLTTVFSRTLADTICVHFIVFATIWANKVNGFLSHRGILTKYIGSHKPKYFDIACQRITDAYKQPDMFVPAPAKATQEAMEI